MKLQDGIVNNCRYGFKLQDGIANNCRYGFKLQDGIVNNCRYIKNVQDSISGFGSIVFLYRYGRSMVNNRSQKALNTQILFRLSAFVVK